MRKITRIVAFAVCALVAGVAVAVYALFHGYFDRGQFEVEQAQWSSPKQLAVVVKRSSALPPSVSLLTSEPRQYLAGASASLGCCLDKQLQNFVSARENSALLRVKSASARCRSFAQAKCFSNSCSRKPRTLWMDSRSILSQLACSAWLRKLK